MHLLQNMRDYKDASVTRMHLLQDASVYLLEHCYELANGATDINDTALLFSHCKYCSKQNSKYCSALVGHCKYCSQKAQNIVRHKGGKKVMSKIVSL